MKTRDEHLAVDNPARPRAALGLLAGGVAHDYNNLLTVINSSASLLLETPGLAPEALAAARRILVAGERAVSLTRQLMLFSGEQPRHPQALVLNDHIREWTATLRRLAGPAVALELGLDPAAPLLMADVTMLEQVLNNLVANARDAMPQGGRLVISTAPVHLTAAEAGRHPAGRPGDFFCLGVADQGTGIAAEDLPHIFEPFFTTRTAGQGTGLGLAVAAGIVQAHDGWMAVETQVGAGTVFRVFLPAAPAGSVEVARREPASLRGHETILLVEDDELVRETTAAFLRSSGYRILQAGSGAEAMEVWQWHASRIALLLTDVVLPDNQSGLELGEKFRREKADLKVICVSGFNREMMDRMATPPAGTLFIQKPCAPLALVKAVRLLLESDPQQIPAP